MAATLDLSFRPLTREDFPLVTKWLLEPEVARWWNHDVAPGALERDFGPAIDGTEPADVLIVSLGGAPFGLVQRFVIADYPEYVAELAPLIAVPPGAISVDYLIGEPDHRGRGLGAAMIAASVAEARDVIVPVSAGNTASWRALERAGFVRVAEGELEPDNPAEGRDHVVYRLTAA